MEKRHGSPTVKTLREIQAEDLSDLSTTMLRQVIMAHCAEHDIEANMSQSARRRELLARPRQMKTQRTQGGSNLPRTDLTQRH